MSVVSSIPSVSGPSISVVIPVYNAARYLENALASIQAQTFSDFEIITVDDGSTDGSKAILDRRARADSRFRVISRPNTGIVGALNDGLAVARGEFIARMDADDICMPERFKCQLAYLSTHPECVCVGSAFNYVDSRGALLMTNARVTSHEEIEQALLTGDGGTLIHPVVMLRRDAVKRAGRYRAEAEWVEDLDLYLRLAQIGRLANLPDVLIHYRYHSQSVNFTRNKGRQERMLWVLEQAFLARGLVFNRSAWPRCPPVSINGASDARQFAISSLYFGTLHTPWRYALRAARLAPSDRRSWQVLSYVAKVSLGLISRHECPPSRQK